jgi:hypothetical protein
MHGYRRFRVWRLAASLWLVLPLSGCGTESDSTREVAAESDAIAAQSVVVPGANCVLATTHLTCASPARPMNCSIQTQGEDTRPTTVTCCLQSDPGIAGMNCAPTPSGTGGIVRQKEGDPEPR